MPQSTTPDQSDQAAASRLLGLLWPGALAAQSLHVAATLGLAEAIGDGAVDGRELASRTSTNPSALFRLLRALATVGVFHEVVPGRFENTDSSRLLGADHPASVRPWALMLGSPWVTSSWNALEHSTRTGESGFRHAFGCRFDEYMAANPDDAAVYDRAMSANTAAAVAGLLDAYDFSPYRRVIDVGGGRGELLRAILEAHAKVEGVLFDLPHVVARADALAPLRGRCELVGGDFFANLPAGGDLYVLKHVVHSLDDDDASRLLENCREACGVDGTLLLIEGIVEEGAEQGVAKAFMDLMMLSLVGGRERTEPEFRELLHSSGFETCTIRRTAGPSSLIEARPLRSVEH